MRPVPNGPRIVSLATALPEHRVAQEDARRAAERIFAPGLPAGDQRLFAVFDHAGIRTRHFCEPLDWYETPRGFGERNAAWLRHALELSERAASEALRRCGLSAEDVDHVLFVSSTGLATPSLDARLVNRMPFREDVRRTPIWGLGCAGGAAGLARARELAVAEPESRILLVALELCSLTFQRRDLDRRNLVAASLFADGAAAAVVCGAGARVPHAPFRPVAVAGARSTIWRDTLDVMGWDVDDDGLHVVFSRDIPTFVRDRLRPALEQFLDQNGLWLGVIQHFVAHPGGPRVLAAYAEALGLFPAAFRHSAHVLESCGNMSSPTVLFVLERTLAAGDIVPGDRAVLAALGPGFASELVLLEGLEA